MLTFVDHHGTSTPLALPSRRYADPRLSPDGRRVAVHIVEEGRENFVIDLDRGTLMRLTADPGEDETPIWTPDGKWVVYTSTRADHARAIFRRMADGSSGEELLWSGTGHVHLGGFTPDGRMLVLAVTGLRLGRDRTPRGVRAGVSEPRRPLSDVCQPRSRASASRNPTQQPRSTSGPGSTYRSKRARTRRALDR